MDMVILFLKTENSDSDHLEWTKDEWRLSFFFKPA